MQIETPWKSTDQQSLLVRACLSDCGELMSLIQEWESRFDLDEIDFGSMRLLPYLYRRLEECDITAAHQGRIKGVYTRYWYLHNTQILPSLTLLSQLQETGLRFLLLKGISLQSLIYGCDPPTRPADDVDILIPATDIDIWTQLLPSLGFHSTSYYSQNYALLTRKSMGWSSEGSSIDLNWRINEFSLDADFEQRVFSRSTQIQVREFTFESPSIPDHFLHTVLHGSGWNEVPSVRWVLDACLLARTMDESDWQTVIQEIQLCGWRTPMLEQMKYLQIEFDANIPQWVTQAINSLQPTLAGTLAHRALTLPTRSSRRRARVFYAEYLHRRDFTSKPGITWKYPFRLPRVLVSMFVEYRRAIRL